MLYVSLVTMSHNTVFLQNLKRIREQAGKTIADLHRISGVLPNSISQMENHGLRVSAANLRKCYFPLCQSDEERLTLLTQWAIWKDNENYWYSEDTPQLTNHLEKLRDKREHDKSVTVDAAVKEINQLNEGNLKTLTKVAQLLRLQPSFKKMILAYMAIEDNY